MTHERLLQSWQKRLNLVDWRITLIEDPHLAERDDVLGRVVMDHNHRIARLSIMPSTSEMIKFEHLWAKAAGSTYESILVHELVEILFGVSRKSDDAKEYAVNMIANALVIKV